MRKYAHVWGSRLEVNQPAALCGCVTPDGPHTYANRQHRASNLLGVKWGILTDSPLAAGLRLQTSA